MNNSHQDSLFAWIRILRQENVFLPAFWQIHLEQCLLSQGGPQRISVSKFFTTQNQNYAFSILNLLFLSKQKKGSFKSLFPFTYFESLKNTHQSGGVVWWLRRPSPKNQSDGSEFQCHSSWPEKSRPFKVRDTDVRTDAWTQGRKGRVGWMGRLGLTCIHCHV